MKHSDFKKSFKNLPIDNIVRDYVYTLKIPAENFEAAYDLIGLHKFVEDQNENWKKSEYAHARFRESLNFFSRLLNAIENLVNSSFENSPVLNREILRIVNNPSKLILLYNSPKAIFLKTLNNKYPLLFDGAFDALVETIQQHNIANKNYLRGMLAAINFEMQDFDLLPLKDGEENSFENIRNKFEQDNNVSRENFEEVLNNTKQSSNDEVEKLKKIQDTWENAFSKIYNEWVEKAENEMSRSQSVATKLLKKSLQSKIELEQTYKEQMKFQVPAEYWRQRASELNVEGHKFMRWLIGLVVLGASMLFLLLWLSPEDMLESIFSKSPVRAIRWSIIFVTFISFLFLGFRLLKKLCFQVSIWQGMQKKEKNLLCFTYL